MSLLSSRLFLSFTRRQCLPSGSSASTIRSASVVSLTNFDLQHYTSLGDTITRTFASRGRSKNPIFVPPPKNPTIVASIPENAPYPTELPPDDEEAVLAAQMAANWRPGLRKRPLVVSHRLEDFDEEGTFKWTTRHKRCGAVALKLGMMPVWDDWGVRHPCTVLWLDSNIVLRVKTADGPDGYDAVQIGAGEYKKKNVKSTVMGQLRALGLDDADYDVTEHPPYVIREFRITPVEGVAVAPEPGTRIHARHFLAGQSVDVAAISKGKGFQGVLALACYDIVAIFFRVLVPPLTFF